jgi:hypothetical protein
MFDIDQHHTITPLLTFWATARLLGQKRLIRQSPELQSYGFALKVVRRVGLWVRRLTFESSVADWFAAIFSCRWLRSRVGLRACYIPDPLIYLKRQAGLTYLSDEIRRRVGLCEWLIRLLLNLRFPLPWLKVCGVARSFALSSSGDGQSSLRLLYLSVRLV